MTKLKDIGTLGEVLKASPISTSPLWEQPVEAISRVQISSFIGRLSMQGHTAQALAAIHIAREQIDQAITAGQIQPTTSFHIKPVIANKLTAGELACGLAELGQPAAALVMFALESGLDIDTAATLRWDQALSLPLSDSAKALVHSQLRHIRCAYVFWEQTNDGARPLFDINRRLFDTFGMVWSEIEAAYPLLIMSDLKADAADFADFMQDRLGVSTGPLR